MVSARARDEAFVFDETRGRNAESNVASRSSQRVLYVAIGTNLAIMICKYAAAIVTGSSAMLTEAFHSTADGGNELLLLLGMKRSARPADALHPFGHGKALYFYSLLVAVYIFSVGLLLAAVAILLGRESGARLLGERVSGNPQKAKEPRQEISRRASLLDFRVLLNAGRTAICAMWPSPTTAYRILDREDCVLIASSLKSSRELFLLRRLGQSGLDSVRRVQGTRQISTLDLL